MYDIYLLQYNNYYNRIVKFESELSDYRNASTVTPYILNNVNFNTADGINTELVVNIQDERSIEMFDYALVYDSNDNLTRWFIIDANRLRNGQWRISLRRDVIVDNYSNVINAPTFIEKATLSDLDPLIFNSENMTYNQIKQSETLIKDYSNSAWIIGFVPTGVVPTSATINIPETSESYDYNYSITDDIITKRGTTEYDLYYEYRLSNARYYYYPKTHKLYVQYRVNNVYGIKQEIPTHYNPTSSELNLLIQNVKSYFTGDKAYEYNLEEKLLMNNKITFDNNTSKFYELRVTIKNTAVSSSSLKNVANIKLLLQNIIGFSTGYIEDIVGWYGRYAETTYLETVVSGVISYTMPSQRTNLEDAPYDMFAIPLTPRSYVIHTDLYPTYPLFTSQADDKTQLNINIAQAIYKALGKEKCYDMQIVPYCPFTKRHEIINGNVHWYGLTEKDYDVLKDGDDYIQSVIFWCNKSKFSLTEQVKVKIPNESLKVLSETTKFRLVSPNYNGMFEYNPLKLKDYNSFEIEGDDLVANDLWDIDCDYKPGMPYIHIAPRFGNLYGKDFNDARGLICGGDFSLTRVENAWVDYVNNNKNYQNIFDRQIENMEFNNRWNLAEGAVSAAGGIVQGAAMGALAGGPYGAIAGAVVGTAQGALNITETIAKQKETLDYTKDQFGYSLGNIKALPNSLSRVSSMNNNNKLFPFVEFYTCTDREKEALKNKLYYNGMTVGVIGRIADYQQEQKTYIKGKLIRLTGVDFHEVAVIAEEIDKGVFI